MLVALILENERQYTAFQTDLILPEGLSVVQEDNEYLLELSGRKASDHTIISKLRDDGALRMVSYSIGVKPYSDNKGALVIIPLVAADDFVAPATVTLKNSFFATVDGEEFVFDGDTCNVLLLEQQIMGDVNGDGNVNITDATIFINYLSTGSLTSFHIENADLNHDGNVNISDMTVLINMLLQGH